MTLADHLEHVQRSVRPVTLIPELPRGVNPVLHANEGLFSHVELRKAVFGLASGKATREGDLRILQEHGK